jgi:peptidoglycan/LPS O-acetylase OafA/YrhL
MLEAEIATTTALPAASAPSDQAANARRVQIDGLRALAMVGVLYVHFWNNDPLTEHLRVSLFFVVSGFLITHILYKAKLSGRKVNVANYYARRAIRLFPALLVLVLFALVFDMDGFRASFGWHALQLSNIYFSLTESTKPWIAGHLWSLNVLEQYYLIWPLVILLLPIQRIYVVVLTILVGTIFLRVNGGHLGVNGWWTFFVFSADPIAAGALAYLLTTNAKVAEVLRSQPALLASIVVLASPLFLWEGFGHSETYRLLMQPALCAIVVGAFHGYGGLIGWALSNPIVRFLSTISYGVYIYHLMVWWLVVQVVPELFVTDPRTFVVISALSILLATVSWYAIEEPISRLKDKLPTTTSRTGTRP